LKAIVIGSGIAGLATSVRLALKGMNVTVFEANNYPGGKLSAFEQDGYSFDAGPSLFTLPELVDELFDDAQRNPRDYFEYKRKDVACHYFWKDGTHLKSYTNRNEFSEEVERVLNVDRTPVLKHLERAEEIYRYTTPIFMERSLHRWESYWGKEVVDALFHLHHFALLTNMHDYNERKLNHPKLVQLFDRYATYNGSSPFLAPGVMHTISHLEHNHGTYYPKGGMISITNAVHKLAVELGVRFEFNAPVQEIIHQSGKVSGVRIEDRIENAEVVVSNMDVVPTYRKLLPKAKAPERTLKQPRSSSAVIFYWGVKKRFKELDLHNIFFSDNYREEFDCIFNRGELYHDPTIYINNTAVEESGQAPEGCENWFVMINAPGNTGQDWDAMIAESRSRIIAKLNEILKVDLESLIETEDILEPRTIESRTSSYQGSLYGAASNNSMAAFLRHPNFSQKIKGLYFVGGSVHPGGGIPLCLLSARIASGLIDKRELK
jgi:phytoene desaturase